MTLATLRMTKTWLVVAGEDRLVHVKMAGQKASGPNFHV